MNLTDIANLAAQEIDRLLTVPLTKVEQAKIAEIIGKAMEDAVNEASHGHARICQAVLSHDQDLAHKIRQQMEQQKIALIANLSSLR